MDALHQLPPRDCHIDEHAAVLKSVGEVKQAVAQGKAGADVVRNLGMALLTGSRVMPTTWIPHWQPG